MPDISIRMASAMDAEAAVLVMRRSIAQLCAPDHGHDLDRLAGWLGNKTPPHFMAWLADPLNTLIVALHQGEVVGVGGLRSGVGITINYVDPSARFAGVSTALVARLESMLVEAGEPVSYLTSTETALGFYTSRGYVNRDLPAEQRPVYGIALQKRLLPVDGGGKG